MDILKIIKKRATIRKYQNKKIPGKIIDKIIEAGVWGPSLLFRGFQPWEFIVVTDRTLINKVSSMLLKKADAIDVWGSAVMRMSVGVLRVSANTILNSTTIIMVYNNRALLKFVGKVKKPYLKVARFSEISAISAAIQNMILTADSLGIGSCWLDVPLFCEKSISKLFRTKNELVAALALGYPAEKGRRAARKPKKEAATYIK